MTIRTRMSLWYATVMFVALMAMGMLLYYQLIIEPRQEAHRHHHEQDEEVVDPDVFEDVTAIVMWCGFPAALLAVAGGRLVIKNTPRPNANLTPMKRKITVHQLRGLP